MAYRYLLGMFDDEEPLLDAIGRVRDMGWEVHDVLTPFPVHGLDPILGIKETKLHTAGFVFGAFGTSLALFGMSWVTNFDWANNFGGKPNWPIPSFIPITFELTVLCASIGMVVTYYLRNGLSVFKDPEILDNRITDDRFCMVFDLGKYSEDKQREDLAGILGNLGAVEVKVRETNEKVLSHLEQS